MNREQISLDEAVGKKLTAAIWSRGYDGLLLAFNDDSFLVIESQGYRDSRLAEDSFYHKDYLEADLALVFDEATFAEWKREDEARVAKSLDDQTERERKQYEELKAKFEGGNG